jgi:hypothetical protein
MTHGNVSKVVYMSRTFTSIPLSQYIYTIITSNFIEKFSRLRVAAVNVFHYIYHQRNTVSVYPYPSRAFALLGIRSPITN